ncbi:Uncharacterised protein [Shigella sonnei]|nr:Uncharacterised protein [Shigella sonnei]
MHRFTAGKRNRRGPEWVIWYRNQHFVPAVQQCLHCLNDKLRYTIADVNIFHGNITHATSLVVLHDGFTRGVKPFGIAIPLSGRQVAYHVNEDFIWRVKTEWGWVADVQFQYLVTFFFQAFCFFQHRTTDVITDIL